MIPIIMSFLLFNRSKAILDVESRRANDLLLNQAHTGLDRVMKDAQQLNSLITYNERLTGLLYKDLPLEADVYYRAYLIANDFYVYRFTTENIPEFFVYLPRSDLIISPTGIYRSEKYLSLRMSRLGQKYDEWIEQFQFTPGITFAPSATETDYNRVIQTIAMISPLPSSSPYGIPKGWAVIHVDLGVFQEIFDNTEWSDRSVLVVYHESFGLMASSDTTITPREAELVRLDLSSKESGDIVTFRDKPFVMLVRDSEVEVVGWKYVSLVPVGIYADQFTRLTRTTAIAFTIVIIVSVILIVWFTTQRYRPVYRLLSMVKPDPDGVVSLRADEFALITDSLEVTLEEDKRLKREIRESESILGHRYLQQLFTGGLRDPQNTLAQLKRYGVTFPLPFLILALVDVELDEDADPGEAESALLDLWPDAEDEITKVRDLDGETGLLLNIREADVDLFFSRIITWKAKVEEYFPVFLAVGLSDPHPIKTDFTELYREARKALDFRLVKGRSAPIRYGEALSSDGDYYYPIEVEVRLINSIKAGDGQAAQEILADVYAHNFGESLLQAEIARCLMFDLISTMIKTVNSLSEREGESAFWSAIAPITRLMACRSLEQLKEEMDDILERVCDHIVGERGGRNDRLTREIENYVQQHYTEKDLTPDRVADEFKRNKAYLSRFFREHTGLGISTYLKHVRVEEAKRLLVENSSGVHEVAAAVGFSGSNAFIRAFKESEGVTPGQFKTSLYT